MFFVSKLLRDWG